MKRLKRFEKKQSKPFQNPSYPRPSWDWAEVGTLKRSEELENAFLKLHNILVL